MRVYATFGQLITGLDHLLVLNLDSGTVRDQIGLGIAGFRISNYDLTFLLGIFQGYNTAKLRDDCKTLRLTCLKQLLYSRKTLCDISTCYTAGMEGTHGQLGTRLTDRLCCDDADCLTNLYRLAGCHVGTITFCADTDMGLTA